MNRFVRSAAAAALSAAALHALASLALAQATIPLRVVTYNIKQGLGGANSTEFNLAGKMITSLDIDGGGPLRGLNPDVVCFQECNQAALGEVFSFRDAFLPGYDVRTYGGDGFNYNVTFVRPGITVASSSSVSIGGPRSLGKMRISIPGAARDVMIYNAHFKCCGDSASLSQRTTNANSSGNQVSFDINFASPPVYVVFMGDLNSPNNNDNTISGLFTAGVLNLPVESLAGAANPNVTSIATFPSSSSRLDYICLDPLLAAQFDADSNGSFTQTELNSMGFVYFSGDDAGLRSSGDTSVTSIVSDHRPVVFDLRIPRNPALPTFAATDIDQNGQTSVEDLYLWESAYALTSPPTASPAPDLNGDRHVDPTDRQTLRTSLRTGEVADTTTF